MYAGSLPKAWPNPGLAGVTPLARLKARATDTVIEMARSNFRPRVILDRDILADLGVSITPKSYVHVTPMAHAATRSGAPALP